MKLNLVKDDIGIYGVDLFLPSNFNNENKVKISKFIVEPNCCTPWDLHSVSELWYVLEGLGEIQIENEKKIIKKGDIEYIQTNSKHRIINIGDKNVEILSIWWNENEI